MVNRFCVRGMRRRGSLMTELIVAMAVLTVGIWPFLYSFAAEQRMLRVYYQRAVLQEILDGEMEALAAGEWREFPAGPHPYTAHSPALTNLPPGTFVLTVEPHRVRLEWAPENGRAVTMYREVELP